MLINAKLNHTAQIMLGAEEVQTCKRVCNSMETTSSTNILFEIFYGEKLKTIGLFSEFGRIAYVTKIENIKIQTKDNTYKEIMVGYTKNHTTETYRL